MRVFKTTFNGFYVTGAAVIVAEDKEQAVQMLQKELDNMIQDGSGQPLPTQTVQKIQLIEIDCVLPKVHILSNGDY